MALEVETATPKDIVAAWDTGESIWSIEMGGIGPGYEQAIQLLMVELLRDNADTPLPDPKSKQADIWGDPTVHRLNLTCGFSGAQVGAARQIAYRILRDGYAAMVNSIPDGRKILVSNHWPRVPEIG